MLTSDLVKVEMTAHDAALFVLFQQHYHQFGFMTASGVWDIRNGSANLSFNADGELKSIKRELYTYSNSYPQSKLA